MTEFILYGTSACHLCETAAAMLESARAGGIEVACREVDISESDELFSRYGVRIPVLRAPDGRELDWPFEGQSLVEFLRASGAHAHR